MKKVFFSACVMILTTALFFSLVGCGPKSSDEKTVMTNQTTSASPKTQDTAAPEKTEETTAAESTAAEPTPTAPPGLLDYFPLTPNVSCTYKGTGNEFAARTTYVEFVWPDMIQIVSDNAAGESHLLYAVRDGKVEAISINFDLYVREDLSLLAPQDYGEVLLMEPLQVGTHWEVMSGTSTITNLHATVTTPSGTYDALEVTTEGGGSTSRMYFAPGIGMIKLMVSGDSYEVTQELESRTLDTARTEIRTLYYPRMTDTDIEIVYQTIPIEMYTNDSFKDVLTEYFRSPPAAGLQPIFSGNTVINSMWLDAVTGIVTIDLSADFVTEMNVGSGMESSILQCLANTVGSAYGVSEVIITLDGQLYESGHIVLGAGETIAVDFTGAIELT